MVPGQDGKSKRIVGIFVLSRGIITLRCKAAHEDAHTGNRCGKRFDHGRVSRRARQDYRTDAIPPLQAEGLHYSSRSQVHRRAGGRRHRMGSTLKTSTLTFLTIVKTVRVE
jgi:hypothetical protein